MRVIQETIEQVGWEDMNTRQNQPTAKKVIHRRAPGIHLSGVIRHVAISQKILKGIDPVTGKWVGDEDAELCEEDMPLRMALGMAWEEYAAPLYPEMNWQPGELSLDGVSGNPDGISISQPGVEPVPDWTPIIEEFKCTWKSCRHGILAQKLWMWQGMGYAHMYGCLHVRFNILWVNGDYARGGVGGPIYKRYLVEFTPLDLKNLWTMVLLNKNDPKVKVE